MPTLKRLLFCAAALTSQSAWAQIIDLSLDPDSRLQTENSDSFMSVDYYSLAAPELNQVYEFNRTASGATTTFHNHLRSVVESFSAGQIQMSSMVSVTQTQTSTALINSRNTALQRAFFSVATESLVHLNFSWNQSNISLSYRPGKSLFDVTDPENIIVLAPMSASTTPLTYLLSPGRRYQLTMLNQISRTWSTTPSPYSYVGTADLTLRLVPEPAPIAALGGSVGLLLFRRRRGALP